MKIIIEVDTNEDEEVLELIRRLVALLEKESERERCAGVFVAIGPGV